jgi:predicted metal-dependent hydrolase
MHELVLPDGSLTHYTLKRSARRSIGLRIGKQGLVVSIPNRLSMRELERILHQKLHWIHEKLQARATTTTPGVSWQDMTSLWFTGQTIELQIQKDVRNRKVSFTGHALQLRMTDPQDADAIRHKVIQWYKQQALADFQRRTSLLVQKLGLHTPPIYLSNAQSRWGSCNSKGEIRLNWRLIQAPPHIIRYVIVHELAHLKEMNHSSRFWAIVASLDPDYKQAETDLKAWSNELHRVD